ncbi:MAG: hypothetical protein N2559_12395 [Anaerolineae bacterium]|nr:hypothetical protein [Anaerolineae bacterium]
MTKDESKTKQSPRWGLLRPFLLVGAFALIVGLVSCLDAPRFTRIELTDAETARVIWATTVRDGTPITLTWHNSLFDLDVIEEFVTENGVLIQTAVTFTDPRGVPPPIVAPSDVDDLYHTGGAFHARGLRRPFTRIVYRIGEIGNPKMTIGAHTIEFKRAVGFGGSIVLTTRAVGDE